MSLIALTFAAYLAVPGSALAQNEAVLINGEPITSYDIAQRTLWQNLTDGFGERMRALLTSAEFRQKCPLKMYAHPSSQAEAQQIAEHIKKDLIECAKRLVLSEGGATRKAVIDALIGDKLKLQEAKRLSIEITDEEVEGNLLERATASAGSGADGEKPDVNAYYAQFEADGISRKTIQEVIRARLAWRALIHRAYGMRRGPETYPGYESFSRSYLEKLRQKAIIDYREE
jgi:peptidyl-prolyl cis-trans isomerase SurA